MEIELKFDKSVGVDSIDSKDGILYTYAVICNDASGNPYYDRQNEHVPMSVLQKAVHRFMAGDAILKDSHSDRVIGRVEHSQLLNEDCMEHGITFEKSGWRIGARLEPEFKEEIIKNGKIKFSIGGSGKFVAEDEVVKSGETRRYFKTDQSVSKADGQRGRYTELNLEEVSCVVVPAQEPGYETIIKSGEDTPDHSKNSGTGVNNTSKGVLEMDEKDVKELVKTAVAEATAAHEEKVSKLLEFTDEEMTFYKGLESDEDRDEFLKADSDGRTAAIEKAKQEAAEVVEKTGDYISKSELPDLIAAAIAKHEAQNATLAKLSGLPGDEAVKKAFVEAAGGDAKVMEWFNSVAKVADKATQNVGKGTPASADANGADADASSDRLAELEEEVAKENPEWTEIEVFAKAYELNQREIAKTGGSE